MIQIQKQLLLLWMFKLDLGMNQMNIQVWLIFVNTCYLLAHPNIQDLIILTNYWQKDLDIQMHTLMLQIQIIILKLHLNIYTKLQMFLLIFLLILFLMKIQQKERKMLLTQNMKQMYPQKIGKYKTFLHYSQIQNILLVDSVQEIMRLLIRKIQKKL